MRRRVLAFVVVAMVAAAGCGQSAGGGSTSVISSTAPSSSPSASGEESSAIITDSGMVTNQSGASGEAASSTFAASSAAAPSSSTAREKGTIQKEMDKMEMASGDFKNKDWGSMDQQTMNRTAAEWYKLWDDELNSLWQRLMEKINPARKDNTVYLQKEWIKEKEAKIKEAGREMEGGSAQPYLEACEGMRLTRARCYYIGALLVESIGGEPYEIPEDAMKILTEN